MIYCNDCGSITEGEEVRECMLPEVRGVQPPCYDTYIVCSDCGSSDVTDADKCPVCGEYFNREICDVCDTCHEYIFTLFWQMMNKIRDFDETIDAGEIVEAMAEIFEEFYNKYRFK